MAGGLCAQTLTDLGATASTPGTNDIYQLSTRGNQTSPDGLNYYTDNQTSRGTGEPGQTFTTGTNATGYVLTSVAVRTGGRGSSIYNGIGTPQPYYLHFYSISGSTKVHISMACFPYWQLVQPGQQLRGLAVPQKMASL